MRLYTLDPTTISEWRKAGGPRYCMLGDHYNYIYAHPRCRSISEKYPDVPLQKHFFHYPVDTVLLEDGSLADVYPVLDYVMGIWRATGRKEATLPDAEDFVLSAFLTYEDLPMILWAEAARGDYVSQYTIHFYYGLPLPPPEKKTSAPASDSQTERIYLDDEETAYDMAEFMSYLTRIWEEHTGRKMTYTPNIFTFDEWMLNNLNGYPSRLIGEAAEGHQVANLVIRLILGLPIENRRIHRCRK